MVNLKISWSKAAEMVGKSKCILLVGLSFCVAACATGPTAAQLANADYGPPPPENHQQVIKDWFAERLIDPTSPLYRFGNPTQGHTKDSPLYGTQLQFGWIVCGAVNAKNRLGGYVGREPFFTLFKDGSMVFIHDGPAAGEACKRVGG